MAVLPHEGTFSIMYSAFGVPAGAGYREGYLARPDKAGRFPVVVVVPGLDGLTSGDRAMCRAFARVGIAALGMERPQPTGDPLADYASYDDRRALSDLDDVNRFLSSDAVNWAQTPGLGLLGIDVGGRLALEAAARRPWVGSVVVAYTPVTGDEDRDTQVADLLEHLPVPVLGLYGAEDELIAAKVVDEAQTRNDAGQWLLYEGAGHGFLDDSGDGYHAAAATDAMARIIDFFRETLPQAEIEDLG